METFRDRKMVPSPFQRNITGGSSLSFSSCYVYDIRNRGHLHLYRSPCTLPTNISQPAGCTLTSTFFV